MPADLTTAFRTLLLADRGLVGQLATAESVYPDLIPVADGLPAVRYEVLSDRRDRELSGPGTHRVARVQYDAIARTRREADAIAREVERILGDPPRLCPETRLPSAPVVVVEESLQDNRYAREDSPPPGSADTIYRTTVDFVVTYRHEPL